MTDSERTRNPVVAGTFYEASPAALKRQIASCFQHRVGPGALPPPAGAGPRRIRGMISPHAGYLASGPVAAVGYHSLAADGKPDLVVILGPNHHGIGSVLAVPEASYWQTPLGKVAVDQGAADRLASAGCGVSRDDLAHRAEHSIEVQLPFLQYIFGAGLKVLPLSMALQDRSEAGKLGLKLAELFDQETTLIIASSDFTHYEPQQVAETMDKRALALIRTLSIAELAALIERYGMTVCGPGPITAMMTAVKQWGVASGTVLKYGTSGDMIGDYSHVVGYASVVFRKA